MWEGKREEVKVCVEVGIDVGGVHESTYPGHCLHRNSGVVLERQRRGKGREKERKEREKRGRKKRKVGKREKGKEEGREGEGGRGKGEGEGGREGGGSKQTAERHTSHFASCCVL